MTTHPDHFQVAWWAKNLDELDHEIARLALVCGVRILDPGILERILRNDTSVCVTQNPAAFPKLHYLLAMHYAIRERSVEQLGEAQVNVIERDVIARLTKAYQDLVDGFPSR